MRYKVYIKPCKQDLKFSMESGGLGDSTGAPVSNNNALRTGFFELFESDYYTVVISRGLAVNAYFYDETKSFISSQSLLPGSYELSSVADYKPNLRACQISHSSNCKYARIVIHTYIGSGHANIDSKYLKASALNILKKQQAYLIHDEGHPDMRKHLVSPKLSLSDNSSGSLSFTIPPGHDYYQNGINIFTDTVYVIRVYDDGTERIIWDGRPIEEITNFDKSKEVYCEGALAYLNDTRVPYRKGMPTNATVFGFIAGADDDNAILQYHNFVHDELTTRQDRTMYYNLENIKFPTTGFINGAISESSGHVVTNSYNYRVVSSVIRCYTQNITLYINSGFDARIMFYDENDNFVGQSQNRSVTSVSPLTILAGTRFRIVIRRMLENTSERANIKEFCSQVWYKTDVLNPDNKKFGLNYDGKTVSASVYINRGQKYEWWPNFEGALEWLNDYIIKAFGGHMKIRYLAGDTVRSDIIARRLTMIQRFDFTDSIPMYDATQTYSRGHIVAYWHSYESKYRIYMASQSIGTDQSPANYPSKWTEQTDKKYRNGTASSDGGSYLFNPLDFRFPSARVNFGDNLIEYTRTRTIGDVCTKMIPRGKQIEDLSGHNLEYHVCLDSAKVPVEENGQWVLKDVPCETSPYLEDTSLVRRYGVIEACVDFDDAETPAVLKKNAIAWFQDLKRSLIDEIINVNAVFLEKHMTVADSSDPLCDQKCIDLWTKVYVTCLPLELKDEVYYVTAMEIPLDDPAGTSATLTSKKKLVTETGVTAGTISGTNKGIIDRNN